MVFLKIKRCVREAKWGTPTGEFAEASGSDEMWRRQAQVKFDEGETYTLRPPGGNTVLDDFRDLHFFTPADKQELVSALNDCRLDYTNCVHGNIGNWNTSLVTDMYNLMKGGNAPANFNEDISGWDTVV